MGLFEFVFGKGAPKDENAPKQAYYLSNDDAKTFGDIDYMRSSKTVKRTFAKKKGATEHMESVRQISATSAAEVSANNNYSNGYTQPSVTFSSAASAPAQPVAPATTAASTPAPEKASTTEVNTETKAVETSASAPVRRKPSNDMDMFRNMAKNIRR